MEPSRCTEDVLLEGGVRVQVDVSELLQQLGRAALLDPRATVDDEVLLQPGWVVRACPRTRATRAGRGARSGASTGRAPGGRTRARPRRGQPDARHLRRAVGIEGHEVPERARLDQLPRLPGTPTMVEVCTGRATLGVTPAISSIAAVPRTISSRGSPSENRSGNRCEDVWFSSSCAASPRGRRAQGWLRAPRQRRRTSGRRSPQAARATALCSQPRGRRLQRHAVSILPRQLIAVERTRGERPQPRTVEQVLELPHRTLSTARARAGIPATTSPAPTSRVTTAPAPTSAPSPMRTPPRTTAPEPSEAPRSTTRRRAAPSRPAVCSSPSSVVARGRLSLMKRTPWPTKTSSSISTPAQMKAWLWILQRAPIDGAALDLDERADPRVVADPAAVEVRERRGRRRPRRTRRRSISRYGASFAGRRQPRLEERR